MKWTTEEIELLKKYYPDNDIYFLIKIFPERSRCAIMAKAHELKIKKNYSIRKNKIEILLNDDHLSFYLMGYFFADGSVFKDTISFSTNHDIDFLKNICNILCSSFNTSIRKQNVKKVIDCVVKGSKTEHSTSCQSKEFVPKIIEKFKIKYRKTYNPPDVSKWKFNEELLLSMFIGFIDGDGHVNYEKGSKYSTIMVSVHKSWLVFLEYFYDLLVKQFEFDLTKPRIDNKNQAFWSTCNMNVISFFKRHLLKHNLPALDRKWNQVDENYVSRKWQGIMNQRKMYELYLEGKTYKEIASIMNFSYKYVVESCSKLRKQSLQY